MDNLELFAILDHNGNLKKGYSRRNAIYVRKCDAVRYAKQLGDNVVKVTVHRDQAPLFIRESKRG